MRAPRATATTRWAATVAAVILVPSLIAPSGALASGVAPGGTAAPTAATAGQATPGTVASPSAEVEQPTTTAVALSGIDEDVDAPEPDDHDHDQGGVGSLSAEPTLTPALVAEVAIEAPAELVAVTASEDFEPGTVVQLRVQEAEHGWSEWTTLDVDQQHGPDPDTDEAEAARPGSEPLLAVRAVKAQVRVDTPTGEVPDGTSLALVDAPTAASDRMVSAQSLQASAAGQPAIISRAQWGADESWRGRAPYYTDEIRAGFIHHTASTSNYSASQAAAQLRAIYSYHTRSLGHSDIDYNFVVDRYGRLYEGRYGGIDRAVLGGHTAGFNERSFGAVVLGNFHTWSPPASEMAAIKDTLARLFAWKLGLYGINPTSNVSMLSAGFPRPIRYPKGTWATIPATSSHQTVNYTACPGDYLQAQLSSIRALAGKYADKLITAPKPAVTSFTSGSRSSVDVTATSSKAVDWTAEILSPCSDTPIRTYAGSTSGAQSLGFTWNLRDSKGKAVLPAAYRIRLSATDAAGATETPADVTVTMTPDPGGQWGPCARARRVSGASPASTSVRWGRQTAPSSKVVVLTGRADAKTSALAAGIAAAPLARFLDAPLLVTDPASLANTVAADITARGATEVVIVGHTGVVSDSVARAVAALGAKVTRLAGKSMASVAASVAEYMGPTESAVLVAPADDPAPALAGAALAARLGVPALISKDGAIPARTRSALEGRSSVTVAAPGAALSRATLDRALGGRPWSRLTGDTPMEASVAVGTAFPAADSSATVLPKAAAWGWRTATVAASAGSPLLFTKKAKLVPEVAGFLKAREEIDSVASSASSTWLAEGVLGDAHRVLAGLPWSGGTSASVVVPPQPTTTYRATRTNAKPEPVRRGGTLTLATTLTSRFTDGSWRPIPAGAAFVVQFKKTGDTTYRTVGTGYTIDGAARATATAVTSGKWRIVVGGVRARRDYVEVLP